MKRTDRFKMWKELFSNVSDKMFVISADKKGAKVKVKVREMLGKHTGSSVARNILPSFMRPVKHLEGLREVFFCCKRCVKTL